MSLAKSTNHGALAVLAWAFAAWLLAFSSPLEEFELRVLDTGFSALRGRIEAPTDARVVVVGIDPKSLEAFAAPMTLLHGNLAKMLEALKPVKPALVALDVVMPDRNFEQIAPGLDRALLRALATTRQVFPTILAITINEDGTPRKIHASFVNMAKTTPGYALWPIDADGRIRRFDEHIGVTDARQNTLVGVSARTLRIEATPGYIDYSLGKKFDYVPMIDVIEAGERKDTAWLAARFADKVVFLGAIQPYLDTVRVPVGIANWDVPDRDTPGVLVHAQAMRTLLAGRMVQRVDAEVVAALAFLAAILGYLATSPVRVTATMLGGLVALPLFALALLASSRFLPFVWPLFSLLIGVGLRMALEILARLVERRRLRQSFSGSVSPAVMQQLLSGKIQPDAGGVNSTVCVLFSDIRGYTTLSEGKSPREIVDLLNRYFDRMVDIIHKNDGTVVSFMGDGIMAVFGAPQELPNASQSAFSASVEMLAGVREYNRDLAAEGIAPIAVGVGLHLGEAVVGHVGSRTRHDYTAIGDVTNVASRLESSTKEAGYRIVVSAEVAAQLAERDTLTALGPVSLKGHTPVEAFGFGRAVAPTLENPETAET